MQNGICRNCGSRKVYGSNAKGAESGLTTGNGSPLLRLYKDNRWIPDIKLLEMKYYVCQNCGCFEAYVIDVEELQKLDEFDNWQKINPETEAGR